jgi:hypothetical protein
MTRSIEEALLYIIDNARPRDVVEMMATRTPTMPLPRHTVGPLWEAAEYAQIFGAGDEPICFVMFHALTTRALSASLISTPRFHEIARPLLSWGLKEFKPAALRKGYNRLECRTMSGHLEAIELLERLGFQREVVLRDYGAHGETFFQYAWRLPDNVLQHAENSEGTSPSSERGRDGGTRP